MKDVANILTDTLAIYYRMYILHYYDRLDGVRLDDLRLADSVGGLRVGEAVRER